MGDPWKSVTPKGVSAFVNASTSVILFWIAFESSLATVLGIHIAYILVLASLISAYLLRNIGGYDDVQKRSTKQAIFSVVLLWFSTAGYLNFIPEILIQIGIFSNLAHSLFVGTVFFVLIFSISYGLHGKYFTTLMLEHMPWVINPDKYLLFFWAWINLITAGILNIFELNMLWVFVNLFFYFLIPSLFFGTRIQEKHGANVAKKDDYFNDD